MTHNRDTTTFKREKNIVKELLNLNDNIEIEFTDFGWTSRVYLINKGEFVFKFPRTEEVKKEYQREKNAYKLAHNLADDIKIPQIKWEHPDNEYLGYRGIIGDTLSDVADSLSSIDKELLGAKIGNFLKRFHQQSLPDVPLVTLEDEILEHRNKLELGAEEINKVFSKKEVSKIKDLLLKKYPDIMSKKEREEGLCHGDLGHWNMIHGSNKSLGIIDFGDVGYYDISIDFAGLTDPTSLSSALKSYGNENLKEKVKIRQKVLPIFDLPLFLGKEDRGGIDKTLKNINKMIHSQ